MQRIFLILVLFLFSFSLQANQPSNYGARLSYGLIAKEPPHLRGYQVMLTYDPHRFSWDEINLYFDGGISHFWDNTAVHNSTITIYSLAPIFRYTFKRTGFILPYFEVSIGLAYLNHTRIENRNLGIHFAFQDRVGLGALFGASEKLSIGLHAIHYSNARLSGHNSGLTMPVVLDIGYRFS